MISFSSDLSDALSIQTVDRLVACAAPAAAVKHTVAVHSSHSVYKQTQYIMYALITLSFLTITHIVLTPWASPSDAVGAIIIGYILIGQQL